MSADARVARAVQQVRQIERRLRLDPTSHVSSAMHREYQSVVSDLIAEVKDALHLTDSDIYQH